MRYTMNTALLMVINLIISSLLSEKTNSKDESTIH